MQFFLIVVSVVMVSIVSTGCKKVQPKSKQKIITSTDRTVSVAKRNHFYVQDGTGGLFKNVKWYSYEFLNHIIWSHLDVFAIRTKSGVFNFQIVSYQHPVQTYRRGYYTVRWQRDGSGPVKQIEFDASACGNPYSNPDYTQCMKDPKQNAYTLVNLTNGQVRKLTADQAKLNSNWHIGFKKTEIILNSGVSGPLEVLGALRYRDESIFPGGAVDYSRLRDEMKRDQGKGIFAAALKVNQFTYYPPKGIDRVIFEKYWFLQNKNNSRLRQANSANWWMVRSPEADSYLRISVESIAEVLEPKIRTAIRFVYGKQNPGETEFGEQFFHFSLPEFSASNDIQEFCIDFQLESVVDCVKDRAVWDIRLLVVGEQERKWQIYTNNGSFGPMTKNEMLQVSSGRF